MTNYHGLTKSQRRQIVKEGYNAHKLGLDLIKDCPYPKDGMGSRFNMWCHGWWTRQYKTDPTGPLYDPKAA